MSALEADIALLDCYSSGPPTTPSPPVCALALDPGPDVASNNRHARASSKASSVCSAVSTGECRTPDSACTRLTTPSPSRASPPVRRHGPLLLPRVRPRDQALEPPRAEAYTYTDLSSSASARRVVDGLLLCAPAGSVAGLESADAAGMWFPDGLPYWCPADESGVGVPPWMPMPTSMPDDLSSTPPLSLPPLSLPTPSADEARAPSTTLLGFLTGRNPAPSLVRTVSLPLGDAATKHFWWDVRSIRPWAALSSAAAVLALPGAAALLTAPVPAPALPPPPPMASRHPETEMALHAMYASYYLPKLNAALAASTSVSPFASSRLARSPPLQLSAPARSCAGVDDLVLVANPAADSPAAALFGGKPSARVVGLVRTFDRFNSGMRADGTVKRVEYLRGLAALHHAMREHGCRYGFLVTEIELVIARAGAEPTPLFGHLDVAAAVQLSASAADGSGPSRPGSPGPGTPPPPLTACLALWALCQLAADVPPPGHAPWRADIGAPAEGSRRKARPRDAWMPQPQLAEKRAAKRSRGWVWPEDPVCRKELGRRGVRYGRLCR